jgi:8-amino-7-oxononanoate synthase
MTLAGRWAAALDRLRDEGRHRTLCAPAGLDFASNDYLGYAAHPAPPTALSASGAASRLLRGHHPVWDEVEAELAAWHGAEAALVFTSGYAANEGLLSTVVGPRDWVASDRLNHASIGDGLRLAGVRPYRFRHNDLDHLEAGLRAAPPGERFVVTESLFSMDGDRPPLAELVSLAGRYGAHVIADEAHATGCLGPAGGGLVDAAGLRGRVLATVHTGGKALGVPGAYVVGSRLLREYLVNRCRHFLFTTALPPAVGEWWLSAVARAKADAAGRERLHANARRFRSALAAAGVDAIGDGYIVPIVLGDDARAVRVADRLQGQGYDVRAVRPPTVLDGTARLRVSVHADHAPADLDRLAVAIGEAVRA